MHCSLVRTVDAAASLPHASAGRCRHCLALMVMRMALAGEHTGPARLRATSTDGDRRGPDKTAGRRGSIVQYRRPPVRLNRRNAPQPGSVNQSDPVCSRVSRPRNSNVQGQVHRGRPAGQGRGHARKARPRDGGQVSSARAAARAGQCRRARHARRGRARTRATRGGTPDMFGS